METDNPLSFMYDSSESINSDIGLGNTSSNRFKKYLKPEYFGILGSLALSITFFIIGFEKLEVQRKKKFLSDDSTSSQNIRMGVSVFFILAVAFSIPVLVALIRVARKYFKR
jgi:hypothetical protein